MASTIPAASPLKSKPDFALPMPPPLLHTRSGNEIYGNGPQTPTSTGFTTPYATPQGSPSKSKLPPGANELPNAFDNAMNLASSSPTKARQQLAPHSPNKAGRQAFEETVDDSINRPEYSLSPGSPLRKSGKENTPPGFRSPKPTTPNQAAVSRQEPYQARDVDSVAKARYNPQRGLTAEELEKLQLPKVRRLANVTQLCKDIKFLVVVRPLTDHRLSRPLFRPPQLRTSPPESRESLQSAISSSAGDQFRRVRGSEAQIFRPGACQPAQATYKIEAR